MTEGLQKFAGKWKLVRSENFEALLDVMGLNFVMKKMLKLMSPSQNIVVNEDGSVNIKLHSGPVTQDMTFRLDEEFEYDQRNIKIKAKCHMEGEKLIMHQSPDPSSGVKPQTMTREITSDGELVQSIQCEDVVAKRYFQRAS
ncbi:cellular retinoic acid-binding protein 2-like [Liolophura sinensis]|uniref:cellular retinoic acid-binding protein 2-like n=1 Tax=Liolophura sinensis TaxID=3198878 RepID=UPI0031582465